MNNEIKDREKVRNLFSTLDFYRDIMTPNQSVYVDAAKKKFIEVGEVPYYLEFGQWDNLNSILHCLRSKKIDSLKV